MAHRLWQDANSLANKGKNEAYFNYQKKHEQMTKQQQLIEEKKLEIQKRQEEKKKKETEEALKKLYEDKLRSEAARSKRNYHGYSKSKHWPVKDKAEENLPAAAATNIFSNDGSFLEQFQKISGIKVEPKRRRFTSSNQSSGTKNGDTEKGDSAKSAQNNVYGNDGDKDKEEKRKERRWSSPERVTSPPKPYQPQITIQQQQMLHQQNIIQQHQQQVFHNQTAQQQQPSLQQQIFTPQQMQLQMPSQMPMNYPPQYNPMQCGMMLPPPMTPSTIPPPAPLNPGSIPSPSPLQPCSIPSPSPLQPYAIPPPSPLIPHSIPPPSPMVPHSIPQPSPLTPQSIPPPLPLRPQSIPPPVQRPPMFLSMVPPPPPPPPPEEEKSNREPTEIATSPDFDINKHDEKAELTVEDNVKDLLRNDEYSSSSEDEEDQGRQFGPPNEKSLESDSESEPERKSVESNSDKESDTESEHKENSFSDIESSDRGQESQPMPETDSDSDTAKTSNNGSIVPEDTETQFPSEMKDSSNVEDAAPPDLSSEGDSFPGHQTDVGLDPGSLDQGEEAEMKEEDEDSAKEDCKMDNVGTTVMDGKVNVIDSDEQSRPEIKMDVKEELMKQAKEEVIHEVKKEIIHEVKEEVMREVKEEAICEEPMQQKIKEELIQKEVKEEPIQQEIQEDTKSNFEIKTEVKQEPGTAAGSSVKTDEPPVKKKRRSRWADSEEKLEIPPVIPSVPVVPPVMASMPPVMPSTPAGIRPVGMVAPTALGVVNTIVPPLPASVATINVPGMSGAMISKVTRTDSALVAYAMKAFGRTNLTDAEWKKAEDHYKINLLYQDMIKKKEELQRLQAAGKFKYEYDSDEETDGGTWEHKLRSAEMEATQLWADELTEAAKGKHHIGDFLPPDELARFMEKYEALKQGREPDLSDYKEFKLKEDNVGFQMLQKLGWTEGQGLGPDGSGIMDPVNKASMRPEGQGLGVERPDDVEANDDEYDAYRKRMMLAYRFRPNPMNNPRRAYY